MTLVHAKDYASLDVNFRSGSITDAEIEAVADGEVAGYEGSGTSGSLRIINILYSSLQAASDAVARLRSRWPEVCTTIFVYKDGSLVQVIEGDG